MKLNGKDAAIAAAQGNGTLAIERGRAVVYTLGSRRFVWGCRTKAEAEETLAVFHELARRELARRELEHG